MDWSSRLAGGLVTIVGVLNLGIGLLTLFTDLVHLSPAVGGGFLAVGLLTAAIGLLVWQGRWVPTVVALTVFAMLLVFQLSDLTATAPDPATNVADNPAARLAILAVLVVTLALAAVRGRRTGRAGVGQPR